MDYYETDAVVSTGTWVGISLLLAIPFVNVIAMIYMAVASENQNIKNFAKAGLIMIGIAIVISLLGVACQVG